MIFSCERPYAFYGLILLIPALFIAIKKYRLIIVQSRKLIAVAANLPEKKRIKNLPRAIILRTIFRVLAWCLFVFAYAGFSWGSYEVPVQRIGNAVSFVFDISYSMNADDAPGGLTRLQAAANYADMLLQRMDETLVSVTLAKGDGIVAVPLTEDVAAVQSLISALSPTLMSASGSSLGKGVQAAVQSFPSNAAQARHIWVFTDGDETDGGLSSVLDSCMKYGISVSLVGFGTEREVEVLAGDGKTKVMTALRSDKMKKLAIQSSQYAHNLGASTSVEYIDATEVGSALELLKVLQKSKSDGSLSVLYEMVPVERHTVFLLFAILFFAISFIVSEFDFENYRKLFHKKHLSAVLLCAGIMLLSSCANKYAANSREILTSSWAWYQKNYNRATAGFLRVKELAQQNEDMLTLQHAQYNLAVTYIVQNEYDAALSCLSNITRDAPEQVLYAAYYNYGVVAYNKGDYNMAVDCFRNALKVDGTKIKAKENLEIARHQQIVKETHLTENELIPTVQRDNGASMMESVIFQRIRENDQKQWKNSEQTDTAGSSEDY
ncbi:MAG: VWA domain-containing protein [Treponema sp.]|nr:VWA domain-containing protein [Treponema sp.]